MKSKKGFTLIELIVVLAILAVIAAIAVPTAFGSIEKANVAADKASVDGLNSAIRMAATIEKADIALMSGKTVAEATALKATTIKSACDIAKISATNKMLSDGKIAFTPANADGTIAFFSYFGAAENIQSSATQVNTGLKGKTWVEIYSDAAVANLLCNYFKV